MIQSRFINKFSVGAFFAITEKVKEDRLRLCNLRPLRIAAIDGGRSAPPFPSAPAALILSLPLSGGYGHKRARNKRIGPGGGTRRLHHTPSFADHGAEIGLTNV